MRPNLKRLMSIYKNNTLLINLVLVFMLSSFSFFWIVFYLLREMGKIRFLIFFNMLLIQSIFLIFLLFILKFYFKFKKGKNSEFDVRLQETLNNLIENRLYNRRIFDFRMGSAVFCFDACVFAFIYITKGYILTTMTKILFLNLLFLMPSFIIALSLGKNLSIPLGFQDKRQIKFFLSFFIPFLLIYATLIVNVLEPIKPKIPLTYINVLVMGFINFLIFMLGILIQWFWRRQEAKHKKDRISHELYDIEKSFLKAKFPKKYSVFLVSYIIFYTLFIFLFIIYNSYDYFFKINASLSSYIFKNYALYLLLYFYFFFLFTIWIFVILDTLLKDLSDWAKFFKIYYGSTSDNHLAKHPSFEPVKIHAKCVAVLFENNRIDSDYYFETFLVEMINKSSKKIQIVRLYEYQPFVNTIERHILEGDVLTIFGIVRKLIVNNEEKAMIEAFHIEPLRVE